MLTKQDLQQIDKQLEPYFMVIQQDFNVVNGRLDSHETRLDSIDARLDKVEARLDSIEIRLDKVEARLDSIEIRLDKVEARLDSIERKLEEEASYTRQWIREQVIVQMNCDRDRFFELSHILLENKVLTRQNIRKLSTF